MTTPKEQVYDDEIFPLMKQVIAICKEHKIAMLADFALGFDEESQSDVKCTTVLLEDDYEPTDEQLEAYDHLRPKQQFMAFTIHRESENE